MYAAPPKKQKRGSAQLSALRARGWRRWALFPVALEIARAIDALRCMRIDKHVDMRKDTRTDERQACATRRWKGLSLRRF